LLACGNQTNTDTIRWYGYVWLNLEFLVYIYAGLECIQNGSFFSLCTITGTIVFAGHVIEMDRKMWKMIDQCRRKCPMLRSISCRSHKIIDNQLCEHNRVTYLVISGSRELFSYILYAFLLTNIPVNVYLISRSAIEQQKLIDQFILWGIVFVQLVVLIIVFGPLAWCAKVYHAPAKFIPILQPMLRSSSGWLWYKIKYEDLYHRLIDNGPKLAVSIGTVRAITYMASIEFMFMYIGYILMAFSQIIETNING
ncbi:hypothetical protein RDWZM_002693, partial [Blomia tropicalis]